MITEPIRNHWVIEDYRVQPGKAGAHVGQRLYTAELIGALEYVLGKNVMVRQQPAIKVPTGRQLDARGGLLIGRSMHERDAELHAWHYWWRELMGL